MKNARRILASWSRVSRPAPTWAVSTLALLCGCAGGPQEKPQVTPQRPTFSSNTATTAPGTLELEAGIDVDPGDRFSTPATLKWGYRPHTEFFVALSPLEFIGNDIEGFGDLGVGTRARVWQDEGTSAALRLLVKLPTASERLGFSREIDLFTSAIVSHEFDSDTAANFYYELGALGDTEGGGTELQHLLTAALSTNIAEDVSVFGELAGIANAPSGDPLFGVFGLARSVAPNLTFDGGVRLGLNSDAEDVAFLLGLTTNFGYVSDPSGLE